jgi:hypothetical protein
MFPRRRLSLVLWAIGSGWWVAELGAMNQAVEIPLDGNFLVQRAAERLGQRDWIDTQLGLEGSVQGIKWNVKGRYVAAPKQWQSSYQLEFEGGGARGKSRLICDGDTVLRVEQIGSAEPSRRRYRLPDLVKKPVSGDQESDRAVQQEILEEIHSGHGFLGPQLVLRDLAKRLRFFKVELTTLPASPASGDKPVPVYRLTGEWNRATLEEIIRDWGKTRYNLSKVTLDEKIPRSEQIPSSFWEQTPAQLWTDGKIEIHRPRLCRLYLARGDETAWSPFPLLLPPPSLSMAPPILDAGPLALTQRALQSSLWPCRIEWLGPTKSGGPNELLLAVDFRPGPDRAPAPEEVRKIFALPDEELRTARELDLMELIERRRELKRREKPR